MMHTTAQMTARDVQRLGIGDAKTVAAWIEKFGWLEARSGSPKTIYRMSWPALLAMLKDPQTWMAWTPEQIADQALRDWATELRKDKGYGISAGDIARRFAVGYAAPQAWIWRGDFIPGETVVKYGNWWFWSEAVAAYTPPFKRDHRRPGLHDFDTWDRMQHQHRTAWVKVGSLVEDNSTPVTFRRGRFMSAVPILTRRSRKKPSPPAETPALSARTNERTLHYDAMGIAAGARRLLEEP